MTQIQDWIVAYSVPAALSLVVSLNPPIADNNVWRSLSYLHSAACVVGSAILGYSLFANAQNNILHEEEGRELFGLVVVTVWVSLCHSLAKGETVLDHQGASFSTCLAPPLCLDHIRRSYRLRGTAAGVRLCWDHQGARFST
ncbi:transmembrane protein 220-like [Rhineura floridana]|uniref:transmembrane protein 220-like n=1 Tax=Rhineura floridana TaxID=261503 RepID=UPI002AC7E783|nr:transmembrane protein 220-like [Rhineura floridana]